MNVRLSAQAFIMLPVLNIKKNQDRRIRNGHLRVFSNELEELPKLPPGSLVRVLSHKEDYGLAFYNPNMLIAIRLLRANIFNSELLTDRFIKCREFRNTVLSGENSYRLAFGESDLLPGLIIDKFEDYFAVQILSAGWENHKDMLLDALMKVYPETKGIIQKNNSYHRELENLTAEDSLLFGEVPDEIIINENQVLYSVSVAKGQKTGHFFDQRENRQMLRKISNGKAVLDCFSNTGGFSLNAALGAAKYIKAVDISKQCIDNVSKNSMLNKVKIDTVCCDVFDFLKMDEEKFDIVILDPPAFTKSKKNVQQALNGYFVANSLALRKINDLGFLVTASCSQHVDEQSFATTIETAAKKENISLRMIYRGLQSPDHPILTSIPETQYLKFFVYQIIKK